MKVGDMIGTRRLVRRVEGRDRPFWLTRCVCGNEKIVREYELRRGAADSCLTCTRRRQGRERCAQS